MRSWLTFSEGNFHKMKTSGTATATLLTGQGSLFQEGVLHRSVTKGMKTHSNSSLTCFIDCVERSALSYFLEKIVNLKTTNSFLLFDSRLVEEL